VWPKNGGRHENVEIFTIGSRATTFLVEGASEWHIHVQIVAVQMRFGLSIFEKVREYAIIITSTTKPEAFSRN